MEIFCLRQARYPPAEGPSIQMILSILSNIIIQLESIHRILRYGIYETLYLSSNGPAAFHLAEAAKALTAPKAVATARPVPHFMRIQS
jgi:hypothetical protein